MRSKNQSEGIDNLAFEDELLQIKGGRLRPEYFDTSDLLWVGRLHAERSRWDGRKRREWKALSREPWPFDAPHAKLRIALSTLEKMAEPNRPQISLKAAKCECVTGPNLASQRLTAPSTH